MNFWPSRLLACLAPGAALATVFSTAAQQPIQYSQPVDKAGEKVDSIVTESAAKLEGRADQFKAPERLFNFSPDAGLPPPVLPVMPSQSLQAELNRRKNWTLETPQEIIGVPTAEKIFGLPDPSGDDKRTPEERFMRRQDLAAATSATNALRMEDQNQLQDNGNPFAPRTHNSDTSPFTKLNLRPGDPADEQADTGSRKFFDRLVTTPVDSPFSAEAKANSSWSSVFTQQAPLPKPDLEQIAAMERFRAFMDPSAGAVKPVVATPFAPAADPNFQVTPPFNSLGQSYSPVQNDISRPAGITPLPGLTGSSLFNKPQKSLVDPPPWLSTGPQPVGSPFSPINTQKW